MCCGAGTTKQRLAHRAIRPGERQVKVQLLADESKQTGDLQECLEVELGSSESSKQEVESKEAVLIGKGLGDGRLEVELQTTPAAVIQEDGVNQDLASRVRTGYTAVMRTLASSHYNCIRVLQRNALSHGKNLGAFRVMVGKDDHAVLVRDEYSKSERGDRTICLRAAKMMMTLMLYDF